MVDLFDILHLLILIKCVKDSFNQNSTSKMKNTAFIHVEKVFWHLALKGNYREYYM